MPATRARRAARGGARRGTTAWLVGALLAGAWVVSCVQLLRLSQPELFAVGRAADDATVAPTPAPRNATATRAKKPSKARNGTRRGRRGRRGRRRTPAPTPAPTARLAAATSFPFSRGERFVRRGNVQRPVRASSRRFRAGPRKDLENFVAPLLRRMGLLETKGMDWDCYVGLQFTPEHEHNYLLAPAGSLVSSIPGLKEVLGDKEAFARLWRGCVARAAALRDAGALGAAAAAGLCAWTTPAFNAVHKLVDGAPRFAVEGGVDALVDLLAREGPSASARRGGDATPLRRACAARARATRKGIRASRALRGTIARPKVSRSERSAAEGGAPGRPRPFFRPGRRGSSSPSGAT